MARKGRRGEAGAKRNRAPPQLPWGAPRNPYPPLEILSADQLEAIHEGRAVGLIALDDLPALAEVPAVDRVKGTGPFST